MEGKVQLFKGGWKKRPRISCGGKTEGGKIDPQKGHCGKGKLSRIWGKESSTTTTDSYERER